MSDYSDEADEEIVLQENSEKFELEEGYSARDTWP